MCEQTKSTDEFTNEQIENWRNIIITLPSFYLSLDAYALIAPREQIVQVARIVQELLNEELERAINEELERARKEEESKPTNVIRTRPRKKHLVRRLR